MKKLLKVNFIYLFIFRGSHIVGGQNDGRREITHNGM